MRVSPIRLIAILDRNRHNRPVFPYGVLKCFVLCSEGEGEFVKNSETVERRFFNKEELPVSELRVGTTSLEQLSLCFAAYANPQWQPVIE